MAGTKVPSRSRSRSRSRSPSLGPSPRPSPNQGEIAEHAEEPLEFGLAAFAGLLGEGAISSRAEWRGSTGDWAMRSSASR